MVIAHSSDSVVKLDNNYLGLLAFLATDKLLASSQARGID